MQKNNKHDSTSNIIWHKKDTIGYIVLNDPPANIMTGAWFQNFNRLIRSIINKTDVGGIIIHGAKRHFSSGANIKQLRENIGKHVNYNQQTDDINEYPEWLINNRKTFSLIKESRIPVIGALNGICYGSGLELALCCHIRICGTGSLFSLPESTFNLLPGCGGTQRLPDLVGYSKAVELIISGKTIDANEALNIGLVDLVVHKKETLHKAENLMEFILKTYKTYPGMKSHEIIAQYKALKPASQNNRLNH